MRTLLSIKDSQEFWKAFGDERNRRRTRLRKLSFLKKVQIVERMQDSGFIKLHGRSKNRRQGREEKKSAA
jgi:hypothetical protein